MSRLGAYKFKTAEIRPYSFCIVLEESGFGFFFPSVRLHSMFTASRKASTVSGEIRTSIIVLKAFFWMVQLYASSVCLPLGRLQASQVLNTGSLWSHTWRRMLPLGSSPFFFLGIVSSSLLGIKIPASECMFRWHGCLEE